VLFTTFEFLGFLAVVFSIYYLLPTAAGQVGWLILSSLFFYSCQEPRLVFLLILSILLNFVFSWLASQGPKRARFPLLVAGVTLNIALLAFFKYWGLITRTLHMDNPWWDLPLPIGISFFTFEGIMIMVDCYRADRDDQLRPLVEDNWFRQFGKVGLLISFFPHLVSGPIVKARDFFPQIGRKYLRDVDWDLVFRCVIMGYFFKLVLADNLREQTNLINPSSFETYNRTQLTAAAYGYSMQIFADFAGYSLLAIGLGAMFGYRLPDNFRFPYLAGSFSEFWRRWHISLSSFLRDYLFIPLGGSRKGLARTYFNLLMVMVIGGLWHGAAWNFAIWGLAHGLALVLERILNRAFPRVRIWRPLRVFFVFNYVTLAWLIFRCPEPDALTLFLNAWIANTPQDMTWAWRMVGAQALFSIPICLYHWSSLYYPAWVKRHEYIPYGLMLFFILTNPGPPASFIYFQF